MSVRNQFFSFKKGRIHTLLGSFTSISGISAKSFTNSRFLLTQIALKRPG